jgi:hypothetical protein
MVMTGLRGSWLSNVTPASPIRPLTNGCRFQYWSRNRNPKRQGYDFAFSTTFIQEPALRWVSMSTDTVWEDG